MSANQHNGEGKREAPAPGVTVFVCVSCRRAGEEADACKRPGAELADLLRDRLSAAGADDVTVTAMECLAVCKRPCTIAVTARRCWSYIIGDLDPDAHGADIVEAILSYRRSGNGIVPWGERPSCFKTGVVARIPPIGFVQPQPETL